MDTTTGKLYDTVQEARIAGVDPADLVTIQGSPEAVERTAQAVKRYTASPDPKRKARRKAQKQSRRANR